MFGRAPLAFPAARIAACAAAGLGLAAAYATNALPATANIAHALERKETPTALDPTKWTPLKVASKERVTHDTQHFRFSFPDSEQVVGLPVASCLVTRAPIGSEKPDGSKAFVIRPYTPTSPPEARGYLDLVVKGYPQGKMSKHINELEVGDSLDFKGPIMKLEYKPNMKKALGLIAGGSGLTPMLQVASEVLRHPEDKTKVTLIFANKSPGDVILKNQIDEMAKKHKNFKVVYVVDKAEDGWSGEVGHINADLARKHLPPPSDDTLIMVCGPPGMMNSVSGDKESKDSQGEVSGILKELGYTKDHVFKF